MMNGSRSSRPQRRKTQHGFSLIGIMVAAGIIATLAAIAYPSYADMVRRAKRAEAITLLMETMQREERHFSQRNRYFSFSREANPDGLKWYSGTTAGRSSHEIVARQCDGEPLTSCVELVALPGTRAVDSGFTDPACGALSIDSRGTRSPALPACWQ